MSDYWQNLVERFNEAVNIYSPMGLELETDPDAVLERVFKHLYALQDPEVASEYRLVVDWGGMGLNISAQDGEVAFAIYSDKIGRAHV